MFKRKADPTFWFTVNVPVAGDEDQVLQLEGKRLKRDELAGFDDAIVGRTYDDVLADYIVGWRDVEEPFSQEALRDVLQEYPHAALAMVKAYVKEQIEAKQKN